MSERVGFIGLGTMGLPMASNLAKGGVSLVAYDASPAAQAAAARLPGRDGGASVGGRRGPVRGALHLSAQRRDRARGLPGRGRHRRRRPAAGS